MSARDDFTDTAQVERLYRAYEAERIGNWMTAGLSHEEIAKDGVYGHFVDEFGQRFDEERNCDQVDSNPLMHGGYEPRF